MKRLQVQRRTFLVALGLSLAGVLAISPRERARTPAGSTSAVTGEYFAPHREVLAVLIASSTCAGSQVRGFDHAIRNIRSKLEREAKKQGLRPFLVGVALDASVKQGTAFLSRLAPFNEVVAGMFSSNLGVQHYIDGPYPGRLIFPQLLIVRRTTQLGAGGIVRFSHERLLIRVVGADKIIAFSNRRAVLPIGGSYGG